MKYHTPSYEDLYQKHIVEKASRRDLEKEYGVTAPVIDRWFKELNIEFVGRKDRSRPSKQELIDLHITQHKTIQEISLIYGRAQRYIDEWFEYYGIAKQRYRKKRKLNVSRDVLINMHHNSQKSLAEIAETLGVSDVIVGKWFDQFDIEKRQFHNQSTTSKAEIEIADFVRSLGIEPIKTRNVLPNRLELDVFVEQHNFAVEHCGLYWHSELHLPSTYHVTKMRFANAANIKLLTLFEDEWIERRSVVESMIRHNVNCDIDRLYARKCTVGIVTSKTAKAFFEHTHLQGAPGTIYLAVGLFHGDELVGCMSFSKHHRTGNGVVLQRMSFKLNTTVVGGASKLFKYAMSCDFCRDKDISTWSDSRYSNGDVYRQLGFAIHSVLPADYYYVKGQRRFPKQRFQKRFTGCPADITEHQHAKDNGFVRLWDCGKVKWVMVHQK